jgi:hypothetical protein
VHEYLHSPNNKVTKNKLDEKILHIISHCHIGNRSTSCTIEEKYLKDAKLLLSETEKHPNDPRTVFYLAQSYRDAQKFSAFLYEKMGFIPWCVFCGTVSVGL